MLYRKPKETTEYGGMLYFIVRLQMSRNDFGHRRPRFSLLEHTLKKDERH